MFRSDLELSADVVLAQLPEELLIFVLQHKIETDSRTHKYFLNPVQFPQLSEKVKIILVIRIEVPAWIRCQTGPILTSPIGQLF